MFLLSAEEGVYIYICMYVHACGGFGLWADMCVSQCVCMRKYGTPVLSIWDALLAVLLNPIFYDVAP
jgi:hypothetical protein